MLVTCEQMSALENEAFARGATPESLMEKAGAATAQTIREFFPEPRSVVAVCGKGHNAGDALVAARLLATAGWHATAELTFPETDLAPLTARKLAELRAVSPSGIAFASAPVILDGLLGIGARGEPREPLASAVRTINARRRHGAFVVAIDGPSGLDANTGIPAATCIEADLTVTIGHAKVGLVADPAVNFVGRLALAPLEELKTSTGSDAAGLITPELLRLLRQPPAFDSHKGTWGRVGIVAGSRGFLGAARLCAEAALRSGAGLVTLYALPDVYDPLAVNTPPEIMVKPVASLEAVRNDRLDALAIGPGLGGNLDDVICRLVHEAPAPAVVDADALNALSRHPDAWPGFGGPRLFTPHPGEMARLFPASSGLSRRETAEQFAARHGVTVLLKGARTVIAESRQPTVFNTTGHPGMGTGGMGDVLTGVTAALMAHHHTPREAAMLGAWICGRAAERYVFSPGGSAESLVASEVIRHLGGAFGELRG